MTINDMHRFLKFLKNEGQGGYIAPSELDYALNYGSIDKFNEERRQYEATQHLSSNLANFKTIATITVASGFGSLPANYSLATGALKSDRKVDIVPDSEWADVVGDPIDVPSASNIKIAIRSNIEVRPTSVTSFDLLYLKVPTTMVWGYTVVDGNFVYNVGTSTQCDWPTVCHDDIVLRAAAYLGVPLSDELMLRLKSFKKQTESV